MEPRTLVVCYSRSGTTWQVAQHLAKTLRADLEFIEEAGAREGRLGYVRSALEAVARGIPTIRTHRDPKDYELVVIGTPVWVGTMASPIRAYAHQHREVLRNVAMFAVMGGQGAAQTIDELAMLCNVTPVASCILTQSDVRSARYTRRCDEFVHTIEARVGPKVHRATA